MMLNRRQVVIGGAGLVAGGMLTRGTQASSSAPATIRLQLGWTGSNGQIAEIAADELGYFDEYGLKLEIVPGGPNVDGVASVAAGSAEIGQISSSPSVMLARSAGVPIKCFAAGYQEHPFAFFSLPKVPIRSPQDMVGRRIGTNGTSRILLSASAARRHYQ
jgi:NitT/TauT family transport system substrate-binding protein